METFMEGEKRRPEKDSALFRRPRIEMILASALKKPVTIVAAGVGYGKTWAVSSFLEYRHEGKAIWVQLSKMDNEPTHFWNTFLAAIRCVNAELADAMLHDGFPPAHDGIKGLGQLVSGYTQPAAHYALVFDDIHYITDRRVLMFIKIIAEKLRRNMAFVLIAKEVVAEELQWLLASESVSRVYDQELAFTEGEVDEYFQMINLNVGHEVVSDVFEETEGVACAVSMAGTLLKAQPKSAKSIKILLRRNMAKIIEDRIFSRFPQALQQFALKLSLADHLSNGFVDQFDPERQMLEALLQATSMIRFDAYLQEYRIHPVLLTFLKDRQHLMKPEDRNDVYRRAALWCEWNGYKIDAIRYYGRMQDYKSVLKVIMGMQLSAPFEGVDDILEIFGEMPREAMDAIPVSRALYVWLLMSSNHIFEAIKLCRIYIDEVESRIKSTNDMNILFHLYNINGILQIIIANWTGEYHFAEPFKKAADYAGKSTPIDYFPAVVAGIGAFACTIGNGQKGEPERFIESITEAVPYAVKAMRGFMSGFDDLVRAEVSFYRAEMSVSERYALQAIFKSREEGQFYIENAALFLLMRIYMYEGKYEMIKEVFRELERQMEIPEFSNAGVIYELISDWYYITIEEHGNVAGWSKTSQPQSGYETFKLEAEEINRCKYLLGEKDYQHLDAHLEMLGKKYGDSLYFLGNLCFATFRALCAFVLKKRPEAFRILKDAYMMAAPNGFDMPFIEMGAPMAALMRAAMKADTGIPPEWLEDIRSKAMTYSKRIAYVRSRHLEERNPDADTELTEPEIALLKDLSHGLSKTELAETRRITVNTVKLQLQIIFDKLGADGDVEAVRIAASKDII